MIKIYKFFALKNMQNNIQGDLVENGDDGSSAKRSKITTQSEKITKNGVGKTENVVRVGIGCLVIDTKTRKFLLGKRKGSHGAGTFALPGGYLEVGENWVECAKRELKEETGLENVQNWELTYITNNVMKNDNKHHITLFMRGEIEGDTEPRLMEPNKCEGWAWVDFDSEWDEKQPQFLPLQILHEAYQTYKWNPFGAASKINLWS